MSAETARQAFNARILRDDAIYGRIGRIASNAIGLGKVFLKVKVAASVFQLIKSKLSWSGYATTRLADWPALRRLRYVADEREPGREAIRIDKSTFDVTSPLPSPPPPRGPRGVCTSVHPERTRSVTSDHIPLPV